MSSPELPQPTPQHLEALQLLTQHIDATREQFFPWRIDHDEATDRSFTALIFNVNPDLVSHPLERTTPKFDLDDLQWEDKYYLWMLRAHNTPEGREENGSSQGSLSLQRSFRTPFLKGEARLEANIYPVIDSPPRRLLVCPVMDLSTRDHVFEAYVTARNDQRRQAMIEARENPKPAKEWTEEERAAFSAELKRRAEEGFPTVPEDQSRKLNPSDYLVPTELLKCHERAATTEEIMELGRLISSLTLFDVRASGDGLA